MLSLFWLVVAVVADTNRPCRGAANVYGHIMLNIPVLVWSLKSSNIEPGQYLDGWPPGNTGCCRLLNLKIELFQQIVCVMFDLRCLWTPMVNKSTCYIALFALTSRDRWDMTTMKTTWGHKIMTWELGTDTFCRKMDILAYSMAHFTQRSAAHESQTLKLTLFIQFDKD